MKDNMNNNGAVDPALAASITREASTQTYFTIQLLADRPLKADAYRAYAYFRWLDDRLDDYSGDPEAPTALVERQKRLLKQAYAGELPAGVAPEEKLLFALVRNRMRPNNGLQSYIHHMLAVMSFDARRRGRLVSGSELDDYSWHLATAVTEALHFFVGHDKASPVTDNRYQAATGAHIAHMLRDTLEDYTLGYFNIPAEFLLQHRIDPGDVDSDSYRLWVASRVDLARRCFQAGREYLAGVESLRCRLAARLYMVRFERLLDVIEADGFNIRPGYKKRTLLTAGIGI